MSKAARGRHRYCIGQRMLVGATPACRRLCPRVQAYAARDPSSSSSNVLARFKSVLGRGTDSSGGDSAASPRAVSYTARGGLSVPPLLLEVLPGIPGTPGRAETEEAFSASALRAKAF